MQLIWHKQKQFSVRFFFFLLFLLRQKAPWKRIEIPAAAAYKWGSTVSADMQPATRTSPAAEPRR